ncbi:ATPase, class VI, type 11A, isoform CRA_a, partial [Mus musculus]
LRDAGVHCDGAHCHTEARTGHALLDLDQPLCHLGVAALLHCLLPALGRGYLAVPQLPEDVLCVHIHAVQWACLAGYHTACHGRPPP